MDSLVSNSDFVIVTSYAKAVARRVHRLVLDVPTMRIGAVLALRSGKLETATTASPELTALANKEAEAIGLDLKTEFSPETENKLPLDEGLKALVRRQMNEKFELFLSALCSTDKERPAEAVPKSNEDAQLEGCFDMNQTLRG